MMKCSKCKNKAVKNGKQKNGEQRYFCKRCKFSFQKLYCYKAYSRNCNQNIVKLLKESMGTRSIARYLEISSTTVTRRIIQVATTVTKPIVRIGRKHQMDELITFIGNKKRKVCIAYAIDNQTKAVIDFNVGRRNKITLRPVVNTLLLSDSLEIRTDRFNLYEGLIPKVLHKVKRKGTNYIERKNLTLRTHIKRLNRRTIAYSKSLIVLVAILRIYFWG